jgi:hypothetical protein
MKRALIACALAIPLSGCFASNDQSVDGGASNWQAIIQGARSLTQTWCLFDPDGDVLLRLILTGDSALQTAQGLAQAVCRVVNAQSPVDVSNDQPRSLSCVSYLSQPSA